MYRCECCVVSEISGRIMYGTSHAATSSLCYASVLRPLHRLLRAPRRALHQDRQRLGPWPSHVLGSREKRVRREKEGLRLHGTLAPGGKGLPQVVDVWTSRSRALAVAVGLAYTFVPKREKGRKNEKSTPRRGIGTSGSSVGNVSRNAL